MPTIESQPRRVKRQASAPGARIWAKAIAVLSVGAALLAGVTPLQARRAGITVTTTPHGGDLEVQGCNYCHQGGSAPSATITSIANLTGCASGYFCTTPGTSDPQTLTVTSPQAMAGFNLYSSGGTLSVTDTTYTRTISGAYGTELTHKAPKPKDSSGKVTFAYNWTAPSSPGTYTLRAWVNSVNDDKDYVGDKGAQSVEYKLAVCKDGDGDGSYASAPTQCPGAKKDCDDGNSAAKPGGTESCSNTGVDNDCDGDATELTDGVHQGDACASSGSGTCNAGTRACSGGTLICKPASPGAESCLNQGIDNDCDGDATEILDDVHSGDACTSLQPGVCKAGTRVCDAQNAVVCKPGTPGNETCSNLGVDNNCNGDTTEIANYVHTGDACTASGQFGVCAQGTRACSGATLICNPGAPTPGGETCANYGIDNDCDGDTTELQGILHAGDSCNSGGVGQCARGTWSCSGNALLCTSLGPTAGGESCTNLGLDDDCDGDANELTNGVHAGDVCSTSKQGVCAAGTVSCSGGAIVCTQTSTASAEKCDNLDNNCNGLVDEGCDDDNDDYCDPSMVKVGTPSVCPLAGSDCDDTRANVHPGATDGCDGVDNDCDNYTDEDAVAAVCGLGECRRWAGCNDGVQPACVPGTPVAETCSNAGVDNDCDGDEMELIDGIHAGDPCQTGVPGACAIGSAFCNQTTFACGQSTRPNPETCSNVGVDNDCDGDPSEEEDCVLPGLYGDCYYGTRSCGGSGTCFGPSPKPEVCDGRDNDCDGIADDGLTCAQSMTLLARGAFVHSDVQALAMEGSAGSAGASSMGQGGQGGAAASAVPLLGVRRTALEAAEGRVALDGRQSSGEGDEAGCNYAPQGASSRSASTIWLAASLAFLAFARCRRLAVSASAPVRARK